MLPFTIQTFGNALQKYPLSAFIERVHEKMFGNREHSSNSRKPSKAALERPSGWLALAEGVAPEAPDL